uniref:DUF5641 domain-containing protein n=1 Tax=Loa loa TaxID=7209 RepID=A0A1I7VFT4_LOALO
MTLTPKIKGILNIRPLTYANSDDCKIIRPIDFIHPSASLIISTVDDDQDEFKPGNFDTRERIIKYFSGTLKVFDIFWETRERERDKLMSLRERTQREHINPKSNEDRKPRENEIVLINEPETPRGLWKLARIKELKKGKDGVTRSALVEMLNGKLNRPVSALYPLEITPEGSSRIQPTAFKKPTETQINKKNLYPQELGMRMLLNEIQTPRF